MRFGNGGITVKREAGTDFCRHIARHQLANLAANIHRDTVYRVVEIGALFGDACQASAALFLLGSLKDERGVGSCILGLEATNSLKVARISNHGGHFF